MGLFVLAYDNEEDVRNEIIEFLHENGGREIVQCVRTTYLFKSDKTKDVDYWNGKIKAKLELEYYTINEVVLGESENEAGNKLFEIVTKCNPELQESAQKILDKLKE